MADDMYSLTWNNHWEYEVFQQVKFVVQLCFLHLYEIVGNKYKLELIQSNTVHQAKGV